MPGYGASDPLRESPVTLEILADNVAAFMDALGIEAAAAYGYHTGASVATSFARRHPRRVVAAVCEGLLCLDAAERTRYLSHYLEPFVPRWDGAHLAWLWTRVKDQSVFFPWYERNGRTRLRMDATPAAALELKVQDWLRAGEGYWHGYAAAMAYDPRADLASIPTPHYLVGHPGDPLTAHLDRLPPLPGNVRIERSANAAECSLRVLAILAAHADRAAAPPAGPAQPIEGRVWRDYVVSQGVSLRVLRAGAPGAPTAVVQHDAQSSVDACAGLVAGLARTRAAVAVELPGHGETELPSRLDAELPPRLDSAPGAAAVIGECAVLLGGALEALGVEDCDCIGFGAGGAVQAELLHAAARSRAASRRSLTLIAPVDLTAEPVLLAALLESYQPPRGDSHGGYLLRAWHEVRDHRLFFPWFERRLACAAPPAPMPDPAWLHARTVEWLLAGASGTLLRKAELLYPLRDRLRATGVPVRFAAPRDEPRQHMSQALAGAAPLTLLSGPPGTWPRQLMDG
jgi:pimeloyl-ACP methyl ester carboxylesterase